MLMPVPHRGRTYSIPTHPHTVIYWFRNKQIVRSLETLFPANRPDLVIRLFKEAGVQPVKKSTQVRPGCDCLHATARVPPSILKGICNARLIRIAEWDYLGLTVTVPVCGDRLLSLLLDFMHPPWPLHN